MSKSPAFQFYPDDFMGGKPGMMTPEQTHVYIWLMCLDWNQNGFPLDVPILARWCHVTPAVFRKAWTVVQDCFSSREGRWFNERLEKERTKQAEWREKSSKGGKTKRQPPTNHPSSLVDENDEPNGQPNGNTPVSVSSLQFPTPVTALKAPPSPPHAVQDRFSVSAEAEVVERFLATLPTHENSLSWCHTISGWLDGLGMHPAPTTEDIAVGLTQYLTKSDRDYSPRHVAGYVNSARDIRLNPKLPSAPRARVNPADRVSQTIAEMTGRGHA